MNPIIGAIEFVSRQVGVVRIGARLIASAVRGWREGSGDDEKLPEGAWTHATTEHVHRQIDSAARPYTPEEAAEIAEKQRAMRENPTARPPKKPPK